LKGGPALQFRAGGRVLSLFGGALHSVILRALAEGPVQLSELDARAGKPGQKALRGNIGNLIGVGALGKRRLDGEADLLDNELTPLGVELLFVGEVLDMWLENAAGGPLAPESEAAKEAVRALVAGWGSTILRALAVRSLSLLELNELFASFTSAALERRLTGLCKAGLLRTTSADGAGPVFAPTRWLREAVGPLLAAVRCERQHLEASTAPLTRLDVETLLLLAAPLVDAAAIGDGRFRLAVDLGGGGFAGIEASLTDGALSSCVSKLDAEPADWASGSAMSWLDALLDGGTDGLEAGGEASRSLAFASGLHAALRRPAAR
jgi:DNA-binding HxlR family transcriptional regulator